MTLITTKIALSGLNEDEFRPISITELKTVQNNIVKPLLNKEISFDEITGNCLESLRIQEKEVSILEYLIRNSWTKNLGDIDIDQGLDPTSVKGIILQGWTH